MVVGGFDGGWSLSQPYVITLARGSGAVAYRIDSRRPARGKRGDLLVLSADGKGIVMRADALRTRAPARPRAGPAPKPRLSGEEQQNRRRVHRAALPVQEPSRREDAFLLNHAWGHHSLASG